jgi:Fe-S cluster assembly protein SufD
MSGGATANLLPEFERVVARLPGGARIAERRRVALARFAAIGFPSQREEAWKYTSTAALARRQHVVEIDAPFNGERVRRVIAAAGPWDGPQCIFVDGIHRADLSTAVAGSGLRVQPLADAVAGAGGLSEQFAGWGVEESTPMVALNAAFASDGIVIDLAEGAELAAPFRLLFVMTAEIQSRAVFPRVIINAGRRSSMTLVEQYIGESAADGFTNTVTEIFADEGSRLAHYRLQDESPKAYHVGNLIVNQQRASDVVSHSLSFGALMARQDIHVMLRGQDSAISLNGLYIAESRQHVDHHTRVDHFEPNTRSDEYYKGILSGHARGVFNGKVVVHPQAIKTDAQQSNKNLLLSKDAEVDTKPELEIYADDVKCAHGATVGQLDQDALFYLRSRGLGETAARSLLTYAFAGDVLNRLGIVRLQKELAARVAGSLPAAAELLEGM